MPSGGVLTILHASEGNNVLVEVSDTGVGIPPENIAKIFEPFFTTKEVGQRNGPWSRGLLWYLNRAWRQSRRAVRTWSRHYFYDYFTGAEGVGEAKA